MPLPGYAQAYFQASLSRASPCRLAIMPTSIVVADNPSVKQVAGAARRIYCSNRAADKPFTGTLCSAAYAWMTLSKSGRHAASPITPLGRDPYSSSRRCVQPSGLSYRPEPARTGVHRQFCLSDTGSSPTPLAALKKLSGRADRRMRRVGEFIFQLEADAIDLHPRRPVQVSLECFHAVLMVLGVPNAGCATQRPASPRWSR